tara:strand:- start:3245 stop:3472 length:228 start_codon:yes stop_codon:yes gene_type:complete
MVIKKGSNGHTYDIGRIWIASGSSDGVRILYLETEQVHPAYSYARTRPRLQEVGRYYYKVDRSTKDNANRAEGVK